MSAITRCPECDTRFKVSQAQLEAHRGTVRCGHCQATFNAVQHLHDDEPDPQLPLPIELEDTDQASVEAVIKSDRSVAGGNSSALLASPLTLTRQFSVLKTAGQDSRPVSRKRNWPWILGTMLLGLLLLAQSSYYFRVEIAARLPGLKPALASYCKWLRCSIPLPKKAELISIESSSLEASPTQINVIDLNVSLRNRASYVQAFPSIELTLTDAADAAIARRIFQPMEYLGYGEDAKTGLSPTRELGIKLHLDTTDLRPSGYRLFLFYP